VGRELAHMTDEEIAAYRAQPSWPARVAAAHTIPREMRVTDAAALDPDQAARITVPTLLLVGGDSPAWRSEAGSLAAALPDARVAVLGGQGHAADALAPELVAETILPFVRAPH
jgi:pimeloyl-ACP methyl ester carboxylesterase